MKAYYSIIQYCPNLARKEICNIGVGLVDFEQKWLKIKLSENNNRIRRFFGFDPSNRSMAFLDILKNNISDILEIEKDEILKGKKSFQQFINTRTNNIILTDLNSIKYDGSWEECFGKLFWELVLP